MSDEKMIFVKNRPLENIDTMTLLREYEDKSHKGLFFWLLIDCSLLAILYQYLRLGFYLTLIACFIAFIGSILIYFTDKKYNKYEWIRKELDYRLKE